MAGIGIVRKTSKKEEVLEEKGYDVYSLARVSKLGKDLMNLY